MNPYDKARELARAIEQSSQYQRFQEVKNHLDENPSAKSMIEDFQRKQLEVQKKILSGEEDSAEQEHLRELYQALSLDPSAADYLSAEHSLGQMLQEIMQILSDVLER